MTDTPASRSTVLSQDGTAIAYDTFGAGDGVIVIGGALSTGRNYGRFARALGRSFAVHVLERRGRGRSGPQGPDYSIDRELQDLHAVQTATGAAAVFGHSYGGLIALEAARRSTVFSDVAVYEPGVSVRGSIVVDWIPRYRELLTAGDSRGAFATMVRQGGAAPRAIRMLPLSCVRLILRLAIRPQRWQEMQPLLEANLVEHEQIAQFDDATVERYSSISARVLLLGGQKSPGFVTVDLFRAAAGDPGYRRRDHRRARPRRTGPEGTRLDRRAGAPASVRAETSPPRKRGSRVSKLRLNMSLDGSTAGPA